MNVLVVGSGGREHALAWALRRSPLVDQVIVAPGNPGMDGCELVPATTIEAVEALALARQVGLVVIGPEVPLCEGWVDRLRAKGLRVFGPTQAAARLEGSKVYAKEFMARHGIPTAAWAAFEAEAPALAYLHQHGVPVVIKADGLAAGKGVTVAGTMAEAEAAVKECFAGRFGSAGAKVLLEDCLVGEEASILAMVDHHSIVPLASSQDHKRAGEGDTGPNTGGMGAYSPAPVVTPALWQAINTQVLQPFLRGCQQDGLDFRGLIYAGVMITAQGLQVLEFNCRFGDPETQAMLPRLANDLAEGMLAVAENRLASWTPIWRDEAAVCVVLAAGGYPGEYRKGLPMAGLAEAAATGALVFHAGTARQGQDLVTNGGRVLGVVGMGGDIAKAITHAYQAVAEIRWDGMQYRRDIGHRALQR
jgi:phosphoribosylamine---glycine ligase